MLEQLILRHNCERVMRDPVIPLSRVTLLVGPNGSGKSTVLEALSELIENPGRLKWTKDNVPILTKGECRAVLSLSFEKDNPRTINMEYLKGQAYTSAIVMRFRSHGQSNHVMVQGSLEGEEYDVVSLDEPESALDLDGMLMLREKVLSTPHQVILSTHSPILMSLMGEEGVSVQTFGPSPDYAERVMAVYQELLAHGQVPTPQQRLQLVNGM